MLEKLTGMSFGQLGPFVDAVVIWIVVCLAGILVIQIIEIGVALKKRRRLRRRREKKDGKNYNGFHGYRR